MSKCPSCDQNGTLVSVRVRGQEAERICEACAIEWFRDRIVSGDMGSFDARVK